MSGDWKAYKADLKKARSVGLNARKVGFSSREKAEASARLVHEKTGIDMEIFFDD